MKDKTPLLCNQYSQNLKNVSRTDKIGANNHEEMINPIAESASKILDNATNEVIEVSLVDGLMNSWNTKGFNHVTGSGLDKDAADANKESIEGDSDTLKKGTGHEWNHVSITNPLKD